MVETTLHSVPTAPRPEMETAGPLGSLYQRVAVTLNLPTGKRPRTAIIAAHPAANWNQHFAVKPLAEAGFATLGLATRFAGNDTYLTMEEVLLDVGGAVRFAREQGFENIALLGFSGGGSLMASYQSQAEHPTIASTPAGDPPDLREADLIPADALILSAAHPGRAQVLAEGLDPSVIDEHDPFATDPSLDMFIPENGPPYSAEFQRRFRQAQLERNERITKWVWAKLAELRARNDGTRDLQFPVYRASADLRMVDLTIDPSDRKAGAYRGDPKVINRNARGLASCSSLRSWLSQWSVSASQADGYAHARNVSKPALVVTLGADQGVFPAHLQGYYDAIQHEDKEKAWVSGARHFFDGQQDKLQEWTDLITDWLRRKGF